MPNNAQEELAEVVGFEIDEVKTNAAGKLSKRQKSRLRVMSLFVFLPVPVFGFFVWDAYRITNLPNCYDQCDTMQFLRGWLTLSVRVVSLFAGLRFALWLPKVQSRTGTIRIYGGLRYTFRPFNIVVGDTGLSTGWATWSMLLPESKYNGHVQVYYLEVVPYFLKPVLSVEPIED